MIPYIKTLFIYGIMQFGPKGGLSTYGRYNTAIFYTYNSHVLVWNWCGFLICLSKWKNQQLLGYFLHLDLLIECSHSDDCDIRVYILVQCTSMNAYGYLYINFFSNLFWKCFKIRILKFNALNFFSFFEVRWYRPYLYAR